MNTTTIDSSMSADEKSAVAAASALAAVAAELSVTERLRASGALFNIHKDNRKENGPIMSGSIRDAKGISIPVALFSEVAEGTGEIYASLSLGGKDRTRFHGKLFHTNNETGNGPMYSGFIIALPVTRPEQYSQDEWDRAPKVQVCGWRKRNSDGGARIALEIAPRFVAANELEF